MSPGRVSRRHSSKTLENMKHCCVLKSVSGLAESRLCGQGESELGGLGFRVQ